MNAQAAENYNEIILDAWREPWEPDLNELIEAVFLRSDFSAEDVAVAVRTQQEILAKLGIATEHKDEMLPLITYDPERTSAPFLRYSA